MINYLDAVNYYKDTWNITFYFIVAIALIIGIFWTILQANKKKKKDMLEENIIYNHSEDMIEDYQPLKKGREDTPINNYVVPNQNKEYNIDKVSDTQDSNKKTNNYYNHKNNNNKNDYK